MGAAPYKPSGWQTIQVDARVVLDLQLRVRAIEALLRRLERKIDLLDWEEDNGDAFDSETASVYGDEKSPQA